MIIFSKKIIFIHVHKVAGKSISHSIENNFIPKMFQNNEYFRWNYKKLFLKEKMITKNEQISTHSTALDYKKYLKEDYSDFYSFAFVRNPLDWQVSMYFYMSKAKGHPQHNLIKNMKFEQYIEWRCENEVNFQSDYILDKNNQKIISFLGKYENLNTDIKKIEKDTNLKLNLPHLNQVQHENYQNYYDTKTKNLIYEYFKKDFEVLNY